MNIIHTPPSAESKKILEALQDSVTKVLEQKQRLGQYAVLWINEKPVLQGVDAPCNLSKNSISA